jgi:O-antigen/teichoic acid export membrane protein
VNEADREQETRDTVQRETQLAIRNAIKLALSLAGTLVVAIAVRFWIPRALGPDTYGQLHFAESLAMMFFLFATLGVDVYTRKEHSVRVQDAAPYYGGFLLIRWFVCVFAAGGMAVTLYFMGKPADVWRAAMLFAVWMGLKLTAESFAHLLKTAGTVNRLSIARPILKLGWGLLIAAVIVVAPSIELIALAFVILEAASVAWFYVLVKKELGFEFVYDLKAAWPIIIASLGYFMNHLVHRVYERLDVQMLTVMANDEEVGFYGAAANLALAGLLFLPVVNSVILPMAGRIADKSEDSMNAVMRTATRLVITGGVLPSLVMALFAEEITVIAFGVEYAPTAIGLAVLGLLFPLTYVAVVASLHLIQLGRIWTVTKISILGLAVNPALNYFLIPEGLERFGAGGGGVAAATATVVTELVVVVGMWIALGRKGFSVRTATTLLRLAVLCAGITGSHLFTEFLGLWRLPIEVIAFVLGAWAVGLVPKAAVTAVVDRTIGRFR